MYKVEIETAEGEVRYYSNGLEFEDLSEAEERMEFLWNMKAHTELYAAFRVVTVDGDLMTELEC